MLSNGDRVWYTSEMSFEDLKKYIINNDFIEIERYPWVYKGCIRESRPAKASYQTKSIVYVGWD